MKVRAAQFHSTAGGLTLIELLTVLLVAAILIGAGAPGLRQFMLEARMTSEINAFVRAVHLARGSAQRHGSVVAICPADGGLRCQARGPWSSGWLVFMNDDGDDPPRQDPGEAVLLMHPPWAEGRMSANRLAFAFRPGSVRHTNGTVGFCDARGPSAARAVIISPTGRPRVSLATDSNVDLICP